MKPARFLVIHHSAGSRSMSAKDIDRMHRAKGWRGGGYSHVIEGDGRIVEMRGLRQILAANPPINGESIAVCVVGDNTDSSQKWTAVQRASLRKYVETVRFLIPGIKVIGHRNVSGGTPTLCPGVKVEEVL